MAVSKKNNKKIEKSVDYSAQTKNLREYVQSTLFNSYYLEKGYPEKIGELFIPQKDEKFLNFYKKIINWTKKQDESFFTKIQPSETTTIDRYIMPIMAFLGWDNFEDGCSEHTNRETAYHYGENIYKPDILYYHNSKDAQKTDKLKKKKDEQKLHSQKNHSMILEAKKFGLLKNKSKILDEKKNDSTKDRSPEEQTVLYMDMLHGKFAILSDGGIWKFFHSEFRDKEKYFSFDLGKLCLYLLRTIKFNDEDVSLEASDQKLKEINFLLAYFYNVFSYDALYGNRETVSHLIEYTHRYSTHLDEKMKDRFIMAMNWACNGLVKSVIESGESVDDKLEIIQKTAESHLFNIIFFRSLESRGVLPYYDEDNDYKKYSISKTVDDIYANGFDPSENFQKQLSLFSDYYDQRVEKKTKVICSNLISLYKKVHSGYKDFKIEGFRQSVFTNEEWKFANTYQIDDQHMMNIIFYLSLIPKGERDLGEYQLIPFDFLTPREIGSIYESFLEFKIQKAETDLYWNFKKKQWVKNRKNTKELFINEVLHKGEFVFSPDNEERKMSGAYYTPHYIVEYITENSIGKLCKGKNPEEILKLRICDPAMGSGHFISYALDYLIGKYLDAHYLFDVPVNESYGEIKLRILENCIFGVDINPSAVKLAKMSLWLNTAKDNNVLSSLENQIKQGDSLISFNWKKEFASIFKKGGFDCITGNPPYIFAREKLTKNQKEHFQKEYDTQQYQLNTFSLFTEKAVELLKNDGKLGFIVPNSCLTISTLSKFRNYMLRNGNFEIILNFLYKVFDKADLEPVVFIYEKSDFKKKYCLATNVNTDKEMANLKLKKIETDAWREDEENRYFLTIDKESDEILKKMEKVSVPLEELFDVKAGLKAYEAGKGLPHQSSQDVKNRIYDFTTRKNNQTYRYLDGNNVKVFGIEWGGTWLEYGRKLAAPRTFNLFSEPRVLVREITSKYPRSLITTYVEEIYLNNLSIVNILAGKDTDKNDLKVLSVMLSSSLLSFYFLKKTAKAQRRLFPKIILKDLKRFPIILPKGNQKKKILKFADQLLSIKDADSELGKARYEKIMKEVDLLIYSLYGLSEKEMEMNIAA